MSKFALAVVLALAAAGSAQAVVTVTSTNGPDIQPLPAGQSVIYDFESGTPAGLTGNYAIVQGSVSGVYAAPLGDTTHYLAVPGIGTTGAADLSLSQSYGSLSFYWGSIDAYNSVTFFNADGANIGTITGPQVPGAPNDGSQGNALNNRRVNFDFGTDLVKTITFTSTSNSFEVDNIAAGTASSPTPEPTTWAMLVTGIGMVGASMRNRRRSRSVTA